MMLFCQVFRQPVRIVLNKYNCPIYRFVLYFFQCFIKVMLILFNLLVYYLLPIDSLFSRYSVKLFWWLCWWCSFLSWWILCFSICRFTFASHSHSSLETWCLWHHCHFFFFRICMIVAKHAIILSLIILLSCRRICSFSTYIFQVRSSSKSASKTKFPADWGMFCNKWLLWRLLWRGDLLKCFFFIVNCFFFLLFKFILLCFPFVFI